MLYVIIGEEEIVSVLFVIPLFGRVGNDQFKKLTKLAIHLLHIQTLSTVKIAFKVKHMIE